MTRLFQSPIQGSWERLYQALLVEALSPLLAGMLRLVAFYSIASPVLHAALHIDEEERRRLLAEGGSTWSTCSCTACWRPGVEP